MCNSAERFDENFEIERRNIQYIPGNQIIPFFPSPGDFLAEERKGSHQERRHDPCKSREEECKWKQGTGRNVQGRGLE